MQDLGKYKENKLPCIAKNTEKYISFTLGHLCFLDSLNIMNESLGKLVNKLAAGGDDHFHHVKRHYTDPHQRALLLRKGVYPYKWMDRMDKMDYTSLKKKPFTALLPWQEFQMLTTVMHRMCGRPLAWKPWETTMISIWKQMSFSWQIALKILERHVSKTMT